MKRLLLPLAAALAMACLGARLPAEESGTPQTKTVTPDWHYRWHEGRWWYWMSDNSNDNRWMVWTGAAWTPYEQFANCPTAGQAQSYTTGYGSYEIQNEGVAAQPMYGGGSYQPSWSGGSGGNYAGYGWSWGPGTAFRDSPGRRF